MRALDIPRKLHSKQHHNVNARLKLGSLTKSIPTTMDTPSTEASGRERLPSASNYDIVDHLARMGRQLAEIEAQHQQVCDSTL